MLSPARMSLLPGGVRELVSSPASRSRTASLCRTGALISGKYGKSLEQKRMITIEQLDKRRDSTLFSLLSLPLVQDLSYLGTNNHPRPRARSHPRIRLGGLHSRPKSRLLKIPNARRIATVLLCFHASPCLYRSRHLGIPDRARTRAQPTNQSRLLPGMGRRCRF